MGFNLAFKGLIAAVMDGIKPVFRHLASADHLKRCPCGTTHNPNACVNSVIWTRTHKAVFVELDTLWFGVCGAVLCFNQSVAKNNYGFCKLDVRS